MKVMKDSLEKLFRLYSNAGQEKLIGLINYFASEIEVLTFCVADNENLELVVSIAFCEGRNGQTDLVVVGFGTNTDIERPSSTLEKFLVSILKSNADINFNLVSFTCLNPEDNIDQLAPYLNKQNPGYRPIISIFSIPSSGIKRVRLAHDARLFQSMYS